MLRVSVVSEWAEQLFVWYYDENRIFPIEAILKHKQLVCTRKNCRLLFSNISFRSRDIQILKYAN